MKTFWKELSLGLALVAAMSGITAAGIADEGSKTKPETPLMTLWTLPKEGGSITVVAANQKDTLTLPVSNDTIVSGMCLHCMIPLKFKASDAAKNCAVCGCDVTNAACIVEKTIKPATFVTMMQKLAYGTVLRPTYNEPDKPQSGVKNLEVDRKVVLLPVEGLSGQSPDQLTALVKQVGGTKAALLFEGKQLTFTVKDWSLESAAKFEKLIQKSGGKIVHPEQVTPAQ